MLMTLLLLLPLLLLSYFNDAKFLFNLETNSKPISQQPTCSLSGLRTVHLPQSPNHFRLFFNSPPTSSQELSALEFFNGDDEHLGRLELVFIHSHIQLNWNGFITQWYNIQVNSVLEIELITKSNIPSFKLNNKQIPPASFIPEQPPKHSFKIIYDEAAEPDTDYLAISQDQELGDIQVKWQAPIQTIETIETTTINENDLRIKYQLIDYIAFDPQIITRIQISSGQPLPKLKLKMLERTLNSSTNLSVNLKHQSGHFMSYLIALGFATYLSVLFYLSKMSSKSRHSNPNKSTHKLDHHNNHQTTHTNTNSNSNTNAVSKSASRTIAFTLPSSPPLLISTNESNSVLKVSVPAALNLADNRHILFPSKLRNFQK